MNLKDTREDLAQHLNDTLPTYKFRARPMTGTAAARDGWVVARNMEPSDYSRCQVTLIVVVVLSADENVAESLFDDDAVAFIDAVTMWGQPVASVALEPMLLQVNGGTMSAVTITLVTEVES